MEAAVASIIQPTEKPMPHVIVKMHSGRSEQLKAKLAQEVTKAVTSTLSLGEESVSVALEDIAPNDWTERVYRPDILGKPETIYKKPGYNPL
jgi:4-oxalocrotonate tautomerase